MVIVQVGGLDKKLKKGEEEEEVGGETGRGNEKHQVWTVLKRRSGR